MAGYDNYSKSNNAIDAEDDGRYPLTKAVEIVAAKCGVKKKAARMVLKGSFDGEYHHTSKFYNSTDYYDTGKAIKIIDFARDLTREITPAFVIGFQEFALEDEDDPIVFLETAENDSFGMAEFIEYIESNEWKEQAFRYNY